MMCTVGCSEVGFIVSTGFVGKVLCDVHVSLDFLLHLLEGCMQVHLPVLLIQELHELLQLSLGAVVPDLFLLMLPILLTRKREKARLLTIRFKKNIISLAMTVQRLNRIYFKGAELQLHIFLLGSNRAALHESKFTVILMRLTQSLKQAVLTPSPSRKLCADWLPLVNRSFEQQVGGHSGLLE